MEHTLAEDVERDAAWLEAVAVILDEGRMSGTYKYALLRALAEWSPANGRTITFDWLAERFLRYYWPLVLR